MQRRKIKLKRSNGVLENWSDARKHTPKLHHSITPSLLRWFCANGRDLPWRHTDDPYAIWVSEIMLQQTQVKTVIPFWERWMRELPDIKSLATASSERIHKLWEGLGYYTRVRNMQKAAQVILEQHDGQFPQQFEAILALPGIGRYTAGAICSITFNQPTPLIDGNVIRVLTRVFGISENPKNKETNSKLWKLAEELVREAYQIERCRFPDGGKLISTPAHLDFPHCSYLNQSLMEFGSLLCTPRQPRCEQCPIQKHCVAFRTDRVSELPNLGERITATNRRFEAFIAERDGKFLVQQRPDGVVNGHLWEFPNHELTEKKSAPTELLPFVKISKKPICTIKHSITRYRIALNVFRAKPTDDSYAWGQWFTLTELEQLAFPSAHRKILRHLLK